LQLREGDVHAPKGEQAMARRRQPWSLSTNVP
jgi:hypothetical protein